MNWTSKMICLLMIIVSLGSVVCIYSLQNDNDNSEGIGVGYTYIDGVINWTWNDVGTYKIKFILNGSVIDEDSLFVSELPHYETMSIHDVDYLIDGVGKFGFEIENVENRVSKTFWLWGE